jgi:hypothetical protein
LSVCQIMAGRRFCVDFDYKNGAMVSVARSSAARAIILTAHLVKGVYQVQATTVRASFSERFREPPHFAATAEAESSPVLCGIALGGSRNGQTSVDDKSHQAEAAFFQHK